jgi:cell division protein FtsB
MGLISSIIKAISSIFGFLSLKKKQDLIIMTDPDHKIALKKSEEEKLKNEVESTIAEIDKTTNEEQEKYIEKLRKIVSS